MRARICVVTGTRSEYGLLRRIMELIADSEDLMLQVVACGMHLSPEFGLTVREIEADGFKVDARVDMLFSNDTAPAMAKGVGIGIYGMAQAFETLKPDVVVVLGDRVEAFAAATAAALSNILVAHIHGGDKSRGGLDESMRHAITKLAHIHFAASEESAQRILRMGEEPRRVFVVGAPGLDDILTTQLLSKNELSRLLGLDFNKDVIVIVQHPISTEPEMACQQVQETIEAVKMLGVQSLIIAPNSDAGSRSMLDVLKKYEGLPFIKILKTLPRTQYLSALKNCRVLVGNSSSGIIEAPFLGTPVVNIGTRQAGREQPVPILQAGYNRTEIAAQIRKAMTDPEVRRSLQNARRIYGDGKASQRIVEHLRTLAFDYSLRQKTLTY